MVLPPALPVSLLVIDNDVNVHRSLMALSISHPATVRSVTAWTHLETTEPPESLADVIVVDLWLGRDSMHSATTLETVTGWKRPVILYTSEERPAMIAPVLAIGVSALCIKHDGVAALVSALTDLAEGRPPISRPIAQVLDRLPALRARLTGTEAEVLRGLAYGLEVPQIAATLHTSVNTVRTHERNIHAKYRAALGEGRASRQQVLRAALEDGYWDPRLP